MVIPSTEMEFKQKAEKDLQFINKSAGEGSAIFTRVKFITRIAKYALIGLAFLLLESGVFSHFPMFAGRPNLLLPYAVFVALVDDPKAGAVIGLCGGFVSDALFTSPLMFSPIMYSLAAYTAGTIVNRYFTVNLATSYLTLTMAVILREIMEFIFLLGTWGNISIMLAIGQIILPSFFYTMIVALPIYFISRIGVKSKLTRDIYYERAIR